MRYFILLTLLIVIFSQSIDATCKNNQVDINTATSIELDNIYGIGTTKAQEIINSRPFESVDDLINVKGIGEITLEKIKDQDLACVEDEEENDKEIEKNIELESENKITGLNIEKEILEEVENKEIENKVIELIPKTIKTEEDNKNSSKKYAMLGFITFCILLIFLFILRRRKFKNEFG